jgi:hypothetical protein
MQLPFDDGTAVLGVNYCARQLVSVYANVSMHLAWWCAAGAKCVRVLK